MIHSALADFLEREALCYEILIMDDNSQDGSIEKAQELSQTFPIRLINRTENRGLSPAVIDGFDEAKGDYIVVMDADLSHPASAIPKMIAQLKSGESDFVLGSRYVEGGSIDDSWTLWRYINSVVATLPALPLTKVKDPMSGFFAVRKADIPPARELSPIGYKIALEVMVTDLLIVPVRLVSYFTFTTVVRLRIWKPPSVRFSASRCALFSTTTSGSTFSVCSSSLSFCLFVLHETIVISTRIAIDNLVFILFIVF